MIGATYWRAIHYSALKDTLKNPYNPAYQANIGKDLLNPIVFSLTSVDLISPFNKISIAGHSYTKDRGYALEQELIDVEEKIFGEKPSRETTEQIYMLKREMLEVKRAITPLIDICNRLMRFDIILIPEDTRPYFRDVYDHSLRINEMLDNARELVTAALEANFSLTSISQSEVSKKMAGWAAIIAVPTLVAGFYGMNFRFMPELEWQYGYPFVVALTISSCIIVYLFFRRAAGATGAALL